MLLKSGPASCCPSWVIEMDGWLKTVGLPALVRANAGHNDADQRCWGDGSQLPTIGTGGGVVPQKNHPVVPHTLKTLDEAKSWP